MSALSERVSDRKVLALLRAFLRAGVMEDGAVRRPVTGTPQGGVDQLLRGFYRSESYSLARRIDEHLVR